MEAKMVSVSASRALAIVFAAAVLGLSACASDGDSSRRSVGQFGSDAALTAKVKTAIASDVGASTAANINVQSYQGEVQLSGFVSTPDQASQAARAAKDVEGVRSVHNDVVVK
jgi:hyperosmotically inducible protein